MKLCQKCGQSLAEEITKCPSCGGDVGKGREYIDDYRIQEVLHESHASILCRGVKKGRKKPVMIRIFTAQSGVDKKVAARLKRELKELKRLPGDFFVKHHEIKCSSDGLWYRISEWVESERWGDLVSSGRFRDYGLALNLFSKIASILSYLHQSGHFIPHLILNDIMVVEGVEGSLDVKIDYKLSRFIDPKLDRPGPMLKQLLSCHPDIINKRPLDYRSDIWSLGKIFVEILTADFETCDYLQKADVLPLPDDAKVLFKTMLAEDPDLRPRSMKDVSDALNRITDQDIEAAQKQRIEEISTSAQNILRLKKRQGLLALLVVLLVVAAIALWFQSSHRKKDSSAMLEEYANQYAKSVAFVLVDYWLKDGKTKIYANRTEGTAFLVDSEGYLLTNRHVACPWIEDSNISLAISQFRQIQRSPKFGFRIFLWFEGEEAFNRSAALMESPDLEDIYFLRSAYRSDGMPRLSIAGVAKPPAQIRQVVASPLKDDFAVLKIERVPEGRTPIPLDPNLDAQKIPKLSRVITLGFPLGSRTQADTVNVSVAQGHVRRTSENLIQIDAALYGGSSGGPVIDMRGKVIGIASGVATDIVPGIMPIITPLWNLAMVLPITRATDFLEDIKAGQIKWNGILDPTVTDKLKQITDKAIQGRWAEAASLADKELKSSSDPTLVMAGGMTHFCAEDPEGASRLFKQSLSMDPENSLAKLMLLMINRLDGRPSVEPYRTELLDLDWRSPAEFMGYLVRVLEALVDEESALRGWETDSEKSWLYYVVGLIRAQKGEWVDSERLLKEAVMAGDIDSWEYLLARAALDQVQRKRLDSIQADKQWAEYQAEIEAFSRVVQRDLAVKETRRTKLSELGARLEAGTAGPGDKRQAMEEILELRPENGDVLVSLAFYSAMEEDWAQALEYARAFLKREGRQSAGRLRVGLLEAEILHNTGREEEAVVRLEVYDRLTKDPWYRALGECLLSKRTEASLKEKAGKRPENLVTLHTALGFWAEGSGDNKRAIEHYKEALESFMDTWLEFDFSKERIKVLRAPVE